MGRWSFVALALTVFMAVAIGLLFRIAAEHDFSLPPITYPAARPTTMRCLKLGFDVSTPHSPLPPHVRLTPDVAYNLAPDRVWYRADRSREDTVRDQAYWRPAGPDSVDLIFPKWPAYGIRARLRSSDDTMHGRAEVTSDIGGILGWLQTGSATAIAVPCSGISGF